MTGVNFAALVRNYTRTNSTTLADAEIVLLANPAKDDIAAEIMKADEDFFGQIATRDLVASDASDFTSREYPLPEKVLAIKWVEAKLDGTNWVRLTEFEHMRHRRVASEANSLSYYSNNNLGAVYDIFRNSLWIYSGTISAASGGLKLWYIAFPADIETATLALSTDLSLDPTTTSSQLPAHFHELWARRVSIMWKSNKDKPIPLTEREQMYDRDVKNMLESIKNFNKDRSSLGSIPSDAHLQY